MYVSVSAYIENDDGEVLLIQTHNRSDTWEFPGGQVDDHESLTSALKREVKEETGVEIELVNMVGVYQNLAVNVICFVFRAKYIGGNIKLQEDEIKAARFINLKKEDPMHYITRPNLQARYNDAVANNKRVLEIWENTQKQMSRMDD